MLFFKNRSKSIEIVAHLHEFELDRSHDIIQIEKC